MRIFVSHSNQDRVWCDRFVAELRRQGADVWYDNGDASSGKQLLPAIEPEIERCETVVVVLSQASLRSLWLQEEIALATHLGKTIVGVRLESVELQASLGAYLLDASGQSPEEAARAVLAMLSVTAVDKADVQVVVDKADVQVVAAQAALAAAEADFSEVESELAAAGIEYERFGIIGVEEPWTYPPQELPPAPQAAPPPVLQPPATESIALSPDGALMPVPPAAAPRIWEEHAPAPAATRGGSRGAVAADELPPLEEVASTAYYPKEVAPQAWESLLVYLARDDAGARQAVARDAEARLGGRREQFRPASALGKTPLRRGTTLTIVPRLAGFEVNPPSLSVAWQEDAQRHEFRLRASTTPVGQAVNGHVELFVGPLLFAEIPVSIFVALPQPKLDTKRTETSSNQRPSYTEAAAQLYRRIFASYSHRDNEIVRLMETTVQKLGDRYLRDVELLRSGERWNDRLLEAIGEADIFQLFWSKPAAQSPYVEQEWRRALEVQREGRPAFIRPVYWSRAPFALPRELSELHFEPLDLRQLGWGPRRGPLGWLMRGG